MMNATATTDNADQSNHIGVRLGRIGIWAMELRYGDPGPDGYAAAELEELGFGALWIRGGTAGTCGLRRRD
jgi:hypothetical protein